MKRFVISGLLLAAAFVLPAHAGETTFKIATLAPDGSSWMVEMRKSAEVIANATDGRVKFKFYPGGVMGNDKSVLRKIRIGQLHGAAFTAGGIAEVYPDILVYSLPFAFRSHDEVDYVRDKLDPVLKAGLEDAGFVTFGFADGGFAKIMSKSPIRSAADLDGEKSWVPEGDKISYDVLSALGVSPVTLPITDVMTGLQTGLVSAIGASPLGAIAFQWHTRVQYMTDEPLMYLMGVFAIDKKRYAQLSDADSKVVRDELERLFAALNQQNRKDNNSAHEALKGQGIEFVEPTDAGLEEWRTTSEKVSRQLAAEGEFSVELTNRVYDLLEEKRNGGQASH
ncbi:MAG: TRAP transporter substrate-binding protein DctP [Gammaproteobacteria bacterium]|nr:TRAP transporter substrate-binding protein DctP [Gammaproteobacteria bacterium]